MTTEISFISQFLCIEVNIGTQTILDDSHVGLCQVSRIIGISKCSVHHSFKLTSLSYLMAKLSPVKNVEIK